MMPEMVNGRRCGERSFKKFKSIRKTAVILGILVFTVIFIASTYVCDDVFTE
jgi:hypothetical protein